MLMARESIANMAFKYMVRLNNISARQYRFRENVGTQVENNWPVDTSQRFYLSPSLAYVSSNLEVSLRQT